MSVTIFPLLSFGLALLVQTAVISYFMGRLSQRMISAEKRLGDQDTKIDTKIGDQLSLLTQVAELKVEMTHTNKTLDKVCHEMTGVSRQLGNIAMGRVGVSGEMK